MIGFDTDEQDEDFSTSMHGKRSRNAYKLKPLIPSLHLDRLDLVLKREDEYFLRSLSDDCITARSSRRPIVAMNNLTLKIKTIVDNLNGARVIDIANQLLLTDKTSPMMIQSDNKNIHRRIKDCINILLAAKVLVKNQKLIYPAKRNEIPDNPLCHKRETLRELAKKCVALNKLKKKNKALKPLDVPCSSQSSSFLYPGTPSIK